MSLEIRDYLPHARQHLLDEVHRVCPERSRLHKLAQLPQRAEDVDLLQASGIRVWGLGCRILGFRVLGGLEGFRV